MYFYGKLEKSHFEHYWFTFPQLRKEKNGGKKERKQGLEKENEKEKKSSLINASCSEFVNTFVYMFANCSDVDCGMQILLRTKEGSDTVDFIWITV